MKGAFRRIAGAAVLFAASNAAFAQAPGSLLRAVVVSRHGVRTQSGDADDVSVRPKGS